MKYRQKPNVVEAWKLLDAEKEVGTLFGVLKAQAGDMIVRRQDGTLEVYKVGTFAEIFELATDTRSFINIQFQEGPIHEKGVNGAKIEDVILLLEERLKMLNVAPYICRENAIALTKLQEARLWLQERTVQRTARQVEGTCKP